MRGRCLYEEERLRLVLVEDEGGRGGDVVRGGEMVRRGEGGEGVWSGMREAVDDEVLRGESVDVLELDNKLALLAVNELFVSTCFRREAISSSRAEDMGNFLCVETRVSADFRRGFCFSDSDPECCIP